MTKIQYSWIALAVLGFVMTVSAQPLPTTVPDAIQPPKGYQPAVMMKAKGMQVYKAVAGKGGAFEWKLVGPLAELTDAKGTKLGSHYDGPSWEAADGSRIVLDASRKVTPAKAPAPETDVPWLLVPVKSDDAAGAKPGTFSKVEFVQRVATSGGKAPKDPPKRLDSKVGVAYVATYYFWVKAEKHMRCDTGYMCDVCGKDVEAIIDSDLYLRYVMGEVSPLELPRQRERHVRCNPAVAQYIVDPAFEPVVCAGMFAKSALDAEYVKQQEELVTRAWRRLQEIPTLGVAIPDYPLPEVLDKWRQATR